MRARREGSARRVGAALRSVIVPAGLVLAMSCTPDEPATIDRETFVETYVALRVAELRSSGAVIPDEARDSVLAEMGVSDEDLVSFAETHGADVVFMEAVWTEVQNRMVELSSRPDTIG